MLQPDKRKKHPEISQNQVNTEYTSTHTQLEAYRADQSSRTRVTIFTSEQSSYSALDAHIREASIGCHPPRSIRRVATRIAKMYRFCSMYVCICCIAVRLPHVSPDEAITLPHFKRTIAKHDIRTMIFHFLLPGGWIKSPAGGHVDPLDPER